LPTDGSQLFVKFWYLVDGTWELTNYQYTAINDVVDYYVAFGDSITAETGGHDEIPGDDTSADGRNTGGGFEPILNDLLTNSKGYSHTVENEGVSGDESIDGANRIATVLAAHPNADYLLILLGTNDSFGPVPSGVGLSCTGLSLPSNDPGCPGTYKDNMQKIINAVIQAEKVPLMAKVPIRYGDCDFSQGGQCWTFTNPYTNPTNLLISQEYNVALDELRAFNAIEGTLGNPFNPPDLYTYFEGTPLDASGKSVEYDDIIHPGGLGYQSIANLWLQALTE
jgi:lysophospholipase L1-like esterase